MASSITLAARPKYPMPPGLAAYSSSTATCRALTDVFPLYLWCVAEGCCWKTACRCQRTDQHWTCLSCWHQGCWAAAAQTGLQLFLHGPRAACDAGCCSWVGMGQRLGDAGTSEVWKQQQNSRPLLICWAAGKVHASHARRSWSSRAYQHQPHTCSGVCALALWKADAGTDCCLLLLSSPSSATVLTLASLCMMGEGGAASVPLWDLSSGCPHRRAQVRHLDRGTTRQQE